MKLLSYRLKKKAEYQEGWVLIKNERLHQCILQILETKDKEAILKQTRKEQHFLQGGRIKIALDFSLETT